MKQYFFKVMMSLIACFSIKLQAASENNYFNNDISTNLFVTEIFADTGFIDINANLTGAFAGNATWFDYDNDNDLDILISGWNDTVYFTKIYSNENGSFVDIQAPLKGLGTEQGVSWGDYDNDGDVDIAMTGRTDPQNNSSFTKIYRNDNGTFVDIHAPLQALNGGSVTWVDYDNDGSLDLFICGSSNNGSNFSSTLYRNDNGNFTNIYAGFPGVWGSSASWGDYDNDGDKDLFLLGYGELGVTTKLFRNDGGIFTNTFSPFVVCNSGSSEWVDFDNDGDLDLSYNGVAPGGVPVTKLYQNNEGSFETVTTSLKDLCVSAIAWGDFDNDGDYDVAESGSEQFNGANPTTKIYRNDSGTFVDIGTEIPGLWFGSLDWGDFDNDGKLDLLLTGGTNGNYDPVSRVYRNFISVQNTNPSVPQNVSTTLVGEKPQIEWDNASDAETPQEGLTYNVRLGTIPGGSDIINPLSTGTGYRRSPEIGNTGYRNKRIITDLPPGTYYWSVQTVDNGFAGSAFAPEQNFTITTDAQHFAVNEKWNIVSVPARVTDYAKTSLFPTAISGAYAYDDGYYGYTTLENGRGYWIKFSIDQMISMSGGPLTEDTITVTEGWNMIGSLSEILPVSNITSIPGGIVTGNFFMYDGAYQTSSTLEPGKGYWVRVTQAGQLVLNSNLSNPPDNRIRIEDTGEKPPAPPDGEILIQSVIPREYSLSQNYPNPFNPMTKIEYALPVNEFVTLRIYNMLGQEVVTLVNEMQDAGYKTTTFDASGLPSGVYTYKITAGTFIDVKKMLLLK